MKKILSIPFFAVMLTGCFEPNTNDIQAQIINHVFDSIAEEWRGVETLNTVSLESVIGSDGAVREMRYIDKPVFNGDACIYVFEQSDFENTAPLELKLSGFTDVEMINPSKIPLVKKCVIRLLDQTTIEVHDLQYLITDKRIKANKNNPELKGALSQAFKDNKVTYAEVLNIYRKLDSIIADAQKSNVEEFKQSLN